MLTFSRFSSLDSQDHVWRQRFRFDVFFFDSCLDTGYSDRCFPTPGFMLFFPPDTPSQ